MRVLGPGKEKQDVSTCRVNMSTFATAPLADLQNQCSKIVTKTKLAFDAHDRVNVGISSDVMNSI